MRQLSVQKKRVENYDCLIYGVNSLFGMNCVDGKELLG